MKLRPAGSVAAVAILFALANVALAADEDRPRVRAAGPVAADVVFLDVREFRITPAQFEPHELGANEEIRAETNGRDRALYRDGERVAFIGGWEGNYHTWTPGNRVGQALDLAAARRPETYTLTGPGGEIKIENVSLKRRPIGHSDGGPEQHNQLFLTLAEPMRWGETYELKAGLDVDTPVVKIAFDGSQRSEAVHTSHVGYRPTDPGKLGYLSIWMGPAGGYGGYEPGTPFEVRDAETGEVRFTGETTLRVAEEDESYGGQAKGRNFAKADVLACDFSAFDEPGTYTLVVEGVGGSFPFEIGREAWNDAFRVAMTGILHQRSGVEWTTPDFTWDQPRAFHPDQPGSPPVREHGQSQLELVVAHGAHENVMDGWTEADAGEVVPNAWGGYRDAGDHDRHTAHLVVAHRLLELYDLFPDHFRDVRLALPEAGGDVPDLLDEAVWVIDFFRRLQREDGGVYGGIESAGHPVKAEASYNDSLMRFAFKPDVRGTWRYAAAAAQAAHVLGRAGFEEKAGEYRESAVRAWEWAESAYERDRGRLEGIPFWWEIRDDRNLAALYLFAATGEQRYHDVFKETAGFDDGGGAATPFLWDSHDQVDAAFAYADLPDDLGDADLKAAAKRSLLNYAGERARYAEGQAYQFTAADDGAPLLAGNASSVPQGRMFALAHALTGDERWLRWAVVTTLPSVGANPLNLTYTTGLGHRTIEWPLQVDRFVRGEPGPWVGHTVYGVYDFRPVPDWVTRFYVNEQTANPPLAEWPTMESFFDIGPYLMWNENTVWQTQAPAAFVWGYLDARK